MNSPLPATTPQGAVSILTGLDPNTTHVLVRAQESAAPLRPDLNANKGNPSGSQQYARHQHQSDGHPQAQATFHTGPVIAVVPVIPVVPIGVTAEK
ncbi:hypothetical protein [Polaromonas sp. CG_9.11]|uniref:hypothetical protein n=1 Tax=Polaromonas sp. CG_9.11 TaxID=2787730 RepID=UPI0018CBBEBB|nr:hypothetical protein [Polaromonas sp. CG_9.11]MBG6077787.1 hypothetical protein [Polaromonas sp. CG_9.11]